MGKPTTSSIGVFLSFEDLCGAVEVSQCTRSAYKKYIQSGAGRVEGWVGLEKVPRLNSYWDKIDAELIKHHIKLQPGGKPLKQQALCIERSLDAKAFPRV